MKIVGDYFHTNSGNCHLLFHDTRNSKSFLSLLASIAAMYAWEWGCALL